MPNSYNPNRRLLNPIEEAVWLYNYLSIRKFRKLWDDSTGVGKTLKSPQ
jgi:hypothetical protein